MDPEAFRREAHRIADWIADYFAAPERFPVLVAGAARRHPRRAARVGARARRSRSTRSSPTSSASSCPASPTGTIPASSPTSRSPAARPACSPSSCRRRSTSRRCCGARRRRPPSSRRSSLAWLRQLIGLPDAFEGVIYDTASISTLHALAAAREQAVADVRDARPRGAVRPAAVPRLLLRARALVGRQGGDPARPRARLALRRIEADDEFRMRPDALAAAIDEDTRRGVQPMAVVATVGTHVDDQRRSRRRDRRHLRARAASGCTSTRRTPASRRWFPSTAGSCATPRAADSRRRQPAQVAVHAVRSRASSTAAAWTSCARRSR